MSGTEMNRVAKDIVAALERCGGVIRLERLRSSCRSSRDALLLALGSLMKEDAVAVEPGLGDWIVKQLTA